MRITIEAEPQNLMMFYGSSFLLNQLGRHEEAIAGSRSPAAYVGRLKRTYANGRIANHKYAVLRPSPNSPSMIAKRE